MVPDRVRELFLAAHAAERLDVLFRLFLDHVDDVVEGEDTDQAIVVVHHRRGDEVVALEHGAPTSSWSSVARNGAQVLFDQLGDRHRALGAQQPVERDRRP